MIDFVSLHNQTDFSILDSLCSVKELFEKAKELEQPALAITEHGSFASAWDALKLSKSTGVKLIIGVEIYFRDNVKNDDRMRHLVLLAKNATGYRNILTLNKLGFDTDSRIGKRVYPVIDWDMLEQYSEGVICLTACGNGIISQLLMNRRFDDAEAALLRLKNIFGEDLGIEVQPNNMQRGSNVYNDEIDQKFLNYGLIKLGEKLGIRVVAACNTHYTNKEDYETHDVFLSIGSRQPIYSTYRLRYPVPDFYLKSGDEVKAFFSRNYGDDLAEELCANSLYFASKCEDPVWIDPKHSNPSGKELPIFPVKDEADYDEFLKWNSIQGESVRELDEDKRYLRYLCENKLAEKFSNSSDIQNYINRTNEELEVLEYQGFSSYMLIVADFLKWCRNNKIPVGPGRGCVTADTLVLTSNGYIKISDVNIGDKVYTSDGTLKKVCKTFSYNVNEEGIELDTQMGYKTTILTKDHKILASKFNTFNSSKIKRKWTSDPELEWVSVKDLNRDYLLWMKWLKCTPSYKWNSELDLTKFNFCGIVLDNCIEYKYYQENELSVNNISKKCCIPKHTIYNIKKGLNVLDKNNIIKIIDEVLIKNYQISFDEWMKVDTSTKYSIDRTMKLDKDFYYFIGLWVGDGCIRENTNNRSVMISFHENEINNANRIKQYLLKYGINSYLYKKKNEKALQLEINNEIVFNLIKYFISDYKCTSDTKHLPFCFRELSEGNLYSLINGLFDADGSFYKNKENIVTTSFRLALEVKESLLRLKTQSSILKRKVCGNRKDAYSVNFSGLFNKCDKNPNFYKDSGYYFRIKSINPIIINKVYDIEVEENHNYLTTNLISHNSVGGSLVAYLLDIHKADPLKYGLIFARFQNKEREEAPDIDNDISGVYRYKLIEYLKGKYGADNFAAISNINTITPKVYARDIARSCELGGSKESAVEVGNLIADIIPSDIRSISIALDKVPLLLEYSKKYPEIKKYKDIGSKYRAFSTHAAGAVINGRSLVGLVPLRKDKDNNSVIEYDKVNTEQNGFIKIDLLGLSTLDLINSTVKLINANGNNFSIDNIDVNEYDEKTYDLISSGNTYGVFQFGTSDGTVSLCTRVKPKSIEDLAIITTLARPGASDIRDDFIATRNGKKSYKLLHPALENAFGKTLGYGLFDESILQIAKDVAGWSLHSADRIRKMIKSKGKYPEVDKKLRKEFIEGAINNGFDRKISERIWDEEIKKFSSYTFNKSHAVLYSMISFITAYLKAHYPVEFLQANLIHEVNSNTQDAKSNIEKVKKELRQRGVKIVPPDINKSDLSYVLVEDKTLITGLDALKFVGEEAIKDIVAKRPFKSFFDFMVRVDSRKVRANNIQALAACGAFDSFGIYRKLLYLYCSDYRKKLQVWKKKHDPNVEEFTYPWPNDGEWSESEIYALENFYLGEGFICKPHKAYGKFFEGQYSLFSDIKKAKDKDKFQYLKAIVVDFFEFKVKKETSKSYGMPMAKAMLEDKDGDQCMCTIFPDRWKLVQDRLKMVKKNLKFDSGVALYFSGTVNYYNDEVGIILENMYNAVPPPDLPIDRKARKVMLKKPKKEKTDEKKAGSLLEQMEDFLYDQGLIDLDNENVDE